MSHAQIFMLVSGIGLIAVLTPMLFSPAGWSRAVNWSKQATDPVALYLGRSLGGIGVVMGATCLVGAIQNESVRLFLLFLVMVGASATAVHTWGALRGAQPRRETLEIPFLAAWTAWGLFVYAGW